VGWEVHRRTDTTTDERLLSVGEEERGGGEEENGEERGGGDVNGPAGCSPDFFLWDCRAMRLVGRSSAIGDRTRQDKTGEVSVERGEGREGKGAQ
jgi:hypothetical protein